MHCSTEGVHSLKFDYFALLFWTSSCVMHERGFFNVKAQHYYYFFGLKKFPRSFKIFFQNATN